MRSVTKRYTMARLLTMLQLYRFHYEVGRYISLERIVEQTRESY